VAGAVAYVATEPEFTPPVIYSNDTRAKLVFMIEARPSEDGAQVLRPGQPVVVTRQ
jgi:HlyD family secretion protein